MKTQIECFTSDCIDDVLDFERRLREEEDVWGWQIDTAYTDALRRSFIEPAFENALSLLAYQEGRVVGRIDAVKIPSHFDGSIKAYLDWICVVKSSRHQGVGQALMEALRSALKAEGINTLIALTASNEEAQRFYQHVPNAKMHDIGIWIDIK